LNSSSLFFSDLSSPFPSILSFVSSSIADTFCTSPPSYIALSIKIPCFFLTPFSLFFLLSSFFISFIYVIYFFIIFFILFIIYYDITCLYYYSTVLLCQTLLVI